MFLPLAVGLVSLLVVLDFLVKAEQVEREQQLPSKVRPVVRRLVMILVILAAVAGRAAAGQ
jgi:hypothetical protein